MMKVVGCAFLLLAGILALVSMLLAEEAFVFPVGLIAIDNLWDLENGWPFDLSPGALVDLRSKGVEVVNLNGIYDLAHSGHQGRIVFDWVMEDVDTLSKKLARADSFGFLVYAGARTFDDALSRWGHDPVGDSLRPYFRWEGITSNRCSTTTFQDTLDSVASWYIDSLKARLARDDIRSLYRYFFWDEPFHKHVKRVGDTGSPWDDYWWNIWHHSDLTGRFTDSLGVYTLLKHRIEEKDTLHSVWINLSGLRNYHSGDRESANGLCQLQAIIDGDTVPNPPHQFSFDMQIFVYGTPIGDTLRLRQYWTEPIDSMVKEAKAVDQNNPPPVYTTQLQSWGSCNVDTTHNMRIAIPEEVKEIANLAVLHEIKGIMHFVLQSFTQGGDSFGNLLDHDQVPFDAAYEEYVYQRNHEHFSDPETLRPFNPDDPIHDPFRTLPPQPVDTPNYHKYLEDYYEWKYEPYARNYDALGEINNQLHIIGTELLGLWRAPSIATIEADSDSIFLPEIVTFSPTQTSDVYLFFVNKDMKHSQMGFTVRIVRSSVPQPLQSAYILDLSERHLVQQTVDMWYITFRDTLGAGEGKLVRLMAGTELGDAMVADPDVRFGIAGISSPTQQPQYVFTEGDSIKVSATVYNLGFTPLDTVVVKFYDGHRNPSNLMRSDTISLSPLTSTATSDSAASFVWITSHDDIAPHNITVFVEEPLPSAANTGNNEANMALLILPEDYATAVRGDPWDMTETGGSPGTADIDSFQGFVETPDSISGVWEAETKTDSARIFLDLADPIDGSKYNQFSVRLIQDPGSSGQAFLKLGWRTSMGPLGEDSLRYYIGGWDVQDLSLDMNSMWYDHHIASLWIRPVPAEDKVFKLAWVKLTTKKP